MFKKEFDDFKREFEISLNFLGEQISNMEECVKSQELKIKALENKNTELLNKNKNLELRVSCVEIQMQKMEQKALSHSLEISGLPEVALQKPQDTIKSVANKLKVEFEAVNSTRSMPIRKDHPCSLLVELKTTESREQWISAAKQVTPTVGDIVPNALHEMK
ncbi:unnamed protein product [Parnassius apollo]|uniref:(apollo) hypothetical protein n=1 Tax=Parnassius apollo TaxID=110799 RepID=A0A8S3XFX5_PARAO|nr:unnamed protein product [Parnassius apollo]